MHNRKSQAYAILTICRALYTYRNGEQVSKKQAAVWAEQEFPEWSSLIQNALLWRADLRNEQIDHADTFPETLRFVHYAISQFKKEAIRKAQELVNTYLPAERSLSDELIAKRRT
jgi:aminoglycoside adenylyltransferase-like protein